MNYRAPPWLPGGHLQTIVAAKLARSYAGERPVFLRERWGTPDGDFIDVDWLQPKPLTEAPLWVMFHGLEGSSSSHYALACADYARSQDIGFAVVHFRGCSGQLNLAPRAYHSGDYEEIGWLLQRFASLHSGPICAIGISLGGNALMRWAEEAGHSACATVRAGGVGAVCARRNDANVAMALALGFVKSLDDQETCVFALRARVGLQADACIAGGLAQPLAQLLVKQGIALELVSGCKGVHVGKLGPGDGNHLAGGVEFHGARA